MLKDIVLSTLSAPTTCYGHCEEPATLKIIQERPVLLGAIVCPSGYVSRLVLYGTEVDLSFLRDTVTNASSGTLEVKDYDLRKATRHPWDLGVGDIDRLQEGYWTQSYRRTKSEDPHRTALFCCISCSNLYAGQLDTAPPTCPACTKKGQA